MKTVFKTAEGYQKPLCLIVEVSQEGLLCSSLEKEYNATLDSYKLNEESYW